MPPHKVNSHNANLFTYDVTWRNNNTANKLVRFVWMRIEICPIGHFRPLFQSEAWYSSFHKKICSHSHANAKPIFIWKDKHQNSLWKRGQKVIGKWPIRGKPTLIIVKRCPLVPSSSLHQHLWRKIAHVKVIKCRRNSRTQGDTVIQYTLRFQSVLAVT